MGKKIIRMNTPKHKQDAPILIGSTGTYGTNGTVEEIRK